MSARSQREELDSMGVDVDDEDGVGVISHVVQLLSFDF